MTLTPDITSLQNPKVKHLVKLRDRRARDKSAQFLIEGYRELLRACEGELHFETLFICESLFLGSNEESLIEMIKRRGATVLTCSESVFRKISYRDRPDGLLAIAPQQKRGLNELEALLETKSTPPFLLVVETIEKPGNLGTCLRSSDASGVDAVIVCDRCTDIHNPNVVRSSVGTLFTVPVFEGNGEEILSWLKEKRIEILAATPSAKQIYTETNLKSGVAIAVGSEQYGLSDRWMEGADQKVKIPMRGKADSLNVATATTLLLYEVLRQRS